MRGRLQVGWTVLDIELSEGAIASSSFYRQKPLRATRLSMPFLSARIAKWASNSPRQSPQQTRSRLGSQPGNRTPISRFRILRPTIKRAGNGSGPWNRTKIDRVKVSRPTLRRGQSLGPRSPSRTALYGFSDHRNDRACSPGNYFSSSTFQ